MNPPKPGKNSTVLDITPEKKDLQRQIAEKEREYNKTLRIVERLKQEMTDFQKMYDGKIKVLSDRLDELESVLFKYRQISEHVDDMFSFADAQKVFDEVMKDRQARIEDEFKKQTKARRQIDRRNLLSPKHREELKRFYRNLAHKFHPDKTGGDDEMMKLINEAYREGNLQALRDLDLQHVSKKADTSISGLQRRFIALTRLIEIVQKEIRTIRKSDLYVLRKNVLKTHKTTDETVLDNLARELKKEIAKKEEQLEVFMQKFSTDTTTNG